MLIKVSHYFASAVYLLLWLTLLPKLRLWTVKAQLDVTQERISVMMVQDGTRSAHVLD